MAKIDLIIVPPKYVMTKTVVYGPFDTRESAMSIASLEATIEASRTDNMIRSNFTVEPIYASKTTDDNKQ